MPDVPVFIRTQSDKDYYAWTTTDANGYFSFGNLPLGQYEIAVDAPNVDEINVPTINLTSQSPSMDSLDFRLHSTYLELFIPTSVTSAQGAIAVQILPNPGGDAQYLLLEIPEDLPTSVALWDVQGRNLSNLVAEVLEPGRHLFQLPSLSPGVYLLKANIGGEVIVRRMVRN